MSQMNVDKAAKQAALARAMRISGLVLLVIGVAIALSLQRPVYYGLAFIGLVETAIGWYLARRAGAAR
jgi:hypothetical protein